MLRSAKSAPCPHRRRARLILACAALAGASRAQEPAGEAKRVRAIRVTTRDVFSDEQAENNWFYGLVNTFHYTTREEIVRSELWFGEGDTIVPDEIEELERNLRAFGTFGAADVELVPVAGTDDEVDVDIATRDRFSLYTSGSVSSVGGVTKFRATVGELNLLGLGKRVTANISRNDEDEESTSLSYLDKQFFGTWHQLTANVGTTDEGHFVTADLRRPFKHLADPLAYGIGFASVEEDVDYYENGDTVAEVPIGRNSGYAFLAHGFGPRDMRMSSGLDARFSHTSYSTARGLEAAQVRMPGNTTRFEIGPTASFDYVHSRQQVTGLDTLDYVEDLQLGTSATARVAAVLRDEDGVGTQVQPLAEVGLRAALEPAPETYLTIDTVGSARWYAGREQGWMVSAAAHVYQRSLPAQTLAASLTFDAAYDAQDLAPQLTLGEDNGLRGYPAREFAGTRVMRLNVEDRIATGIEVLSVHVGAVAFFDVGWVHGTSQDLSLGEAIKSAGVGLRFGSSELVGRNVGRIDFAWPLDDVDGVDYDFSVSFSAGQLFSFFGNATELRSDFR